MIPIKLVIWDLDETFWSGTLSEGNIVYNVNNETIITELSRRGIINSICSKNDSKHVMDVLISHGVDGYFVFSSISWYPKGPRIVQIIKDMQLRPENVLFIDDNPLNLGEAQHYAPGIQVATPSIIEKLLTLEALKGNPDPELSRLTQYKNLEQKHKARRATDESNEDFLRSCSITVFIGMNCLEHSERILDLVNRSNQLNFTKVRLTDIELHDLLHDSSVESRYLTATDRYGDYGICGFYALQGDSMLHFVFSCRVLNMGIEKWLYHRLGRPHLVVSGKVASQLDEAETPDWINVKEESLQSHSARNRGRVIIKGGCDLEQLITYLDPQIEIETEFNYISDKGMPIHTEHTEILRRCTPRTLEYYGTVIDHLPFLDRNAFQTKFFSPNYRAHVYSVLMDITQGLYCYQNTDFVVPFGDFMVDITDEGNWDRYLKFYASKGMTRDFFIWFKENFSFMGVLSLEKFEENIRWMQNKLPSNVTLILMNAAEVPFAHSVEIDRHLHYKHYNATLESLQKKVASINTVICDVRHFITEPQHLTDNIRHYTRQKYFEIACNLNLLLSEVPVEKLHKQRILCFQILNIPGQQFEKTRYFYSAHHSLAEVDRFYKTKDTYETFVQRLREHGFTQVSYRQKEINQALIDTFNNLLNLEIGGMPFPEFLSEGNISLWQFVMPAVYNGPCKEVFEVIEYLSPLVEEYQPDVVVIMGNPLDYQERAAVHLLSCCGIPLNLLKVELETGPVEASEPQASDVFTRRIESGERIALGSYAARLQEGKEFRDSLLMVSYPSSWQKSSHGEIDRYYEAFKPELKTAGWTGVRVELPHYFLIQGSKKAYLDQTITERRGDFDTVFLDAYLSKDDFSRCAEWRQRLTKKFELLVSEESFHTAFSYRGVSFFTPLYQYWHHLFTEYLAGDCLPTLHIARRMLECIKPKALVLTYEVGQYGRALVIEAHKLGIPSFALQHASISDQFKCYTDKDVCNAPDFSRGCYSFIVPGTTFVWGSYHKNILTTKGSYPRESVVCVGNWMATDRDAFLDTVTPLELLNLRKSWFASQRHIALLLTSVSTYGIMDQIAAKLDSEKFCLLIKPHPQEKNGLAYLEYFRQRGFEATLINGYLQEAILLAELVITDLYSTTVGDCLLFGKPIYTYYDREMGWIPPWSGMVLSLEQHESLEVRSISPEKQEAINSFIDAQGLSPQKPPVAAIFARISAALSKNIPTHPKQLLVANQPVKLYAGDIPNQPEYDGWLGLSLTQQNDCHILHDITQTLPFADNSVDAFQAEDVLEHIQYDKLPVVINEIYRILKPGGLFRLSVPDYGCDVLKNRSVKDAMGNIVFDPGGGGTPDNPGHVWFPRVNTVYHLLEKTRFHTNGAVEFLHYWNMDGRSFVTRQVDYSKGHIKRTPDHDDRVKKPYRPMSIVVDMYKTKGL